jgi:hypothetical protein
VGELARRFQSAARLDLAKRQCFTRGRCTQSCRPSRSESFVTPRLGVARSQSIIVSFMFDFASLPRMGRRLTNRRW